MNNAFIFLIKSIFDLYLFVLLIRLLLAFEQVNYFHPATQFIVRLTQPIIGPIRRYLPNYRHIELSTLVVIFFIEFIKFFLLFFLSNITLSLPILLLFTLTSPLKFLLTILFYAIIIQIILSWVQTTQYQQPAMHHLLSAITAPILRPFQRMIPPIAGFDISPIPALILLQFLILLLPG